MKKEYSKKTAVNGENANLRIFMDGFRDRNSVPHISGDIL